MALPTVLVGFGKIAAGYASDRQMAKHYRYATHAQVLADHPEFLWTTVVDPDTSACRSARAWEIDEVVPDLSQLANPEEFSVAVIAGPPTEHINTILGLPRLKAVMVEKPLGLTAEDAEHFLDLCNKRNIIVQVNFSRRADTTLRELAAGELRRQIGKIQVGSGIFGNGLLNNAIHMVDLVSMLIGPICEVQAIGKSKPRLQNPLIGDDDQAFIVTTTTDIQIGFQPINFDHYRENSLDLWGTHGRLEILLDGLVTRLSKVYTHRAITDSKEMASDKCLQLPSTAGDALRCMYDNLADALTKKTGLWSPGETALAATRVIDAVRRSSAHAGAVVRL